jgi:AcrR family transcriptional regulator
MHDTKERLLKAGAQLFGRQGLAGTGIKQILAEAGAPFSSLYHHFPGGKEELAAAVGPALRASCTANCWCPAVFDPAP